MRLAIPAGVCLAAVCVVAVVHPVRAIFPKRNAGFGLVMRAQDAAAMQANTLDQELLADLPRIHPDGRGTFEIERERGTTLLRGTVVDPYSGDSGAAVFPIVDGKRVANAATFYDRKTFRIALPRGAGDCQRLAVGLVAYDQRGYFRLDYLQKH